MFADRGSILSFVVNIMFASKSSLPVGCRSAGRWAFVVTAGGYLATPALHSGPHVDDRNGRGWSPAHTVGGKPSRTKHMHVGRHRQRSFPLGVS